MRHVGAARSRRFHVRPPCGTTASTAHCCVLCSSRRTTTGARGGDAEHRRLILPLSSERVVLRTCWRGARWLPPSMHAHRHMHIICAKPLASLPQCSSHVSCSARHRPPRRPCLRPHLSDPFLPAAQIPRLHMHPSPPQASLNSARRMHRPIMLSGMMRDRQFIGPEPPTRRRQPDRVGPEVDGGVDPWAPITSVHKGPRQSQRR